MGSWWQQPYKGGGPAKVKGFPRPLYPPSAKNHGHTPSKPGPDVKAIKRTISRLGRWPWQEFDEEYSDRFALGNPSSQVEHSGTAGFQRQQKIDDTGWIGQKTFDALRYALVPEGRQHTGEQAMDSVAVNLINEAWEMFQGGEPVPAGKLTRKQMPSPNYSSRGGAKVRLIVIHTAEGALTIEALGNFFASSSAGVSSHTGIDDKKGVIGEYVKPGNKAWTAANANPVAVQTELCAFAKWSKGTWEGHPNMLENCARWIAEEAARFDIPITKLSASAAQGSGRGVCQHDDLGSWGGGHWDCGSGFPIDDVIRRAKEIA
jgi:hypothetical protein